ncbi:MAG: phytanoyl-CoA dioxygenase family protein [Alphaproteobacteria bacterium]|nr:phytanoyl-CoA dioxygenase family protein [Alphaproteobacteria bacterium]
MTPEDILKHRPRVLSRKQRESYFENGYILLEKIVPPDIVERLRATTTEMVNRSRSVTKSDAVWDLENGHSAARPRLRRLSSPCDHHPAYWDYVSKSLLADIAADLLGPDVKFHHSKLNFKASEGGTEVKWHQDIQFWPHTNYSLLTIGTYIYDCGLENGALGVFPGSHLGPLHDQYNDKGQWTGCLGDGDVAKLDQSKAVYLCGPAGSLTIHHCRTIHGSKPNDSAVDRPLFLVTLASSDAHAYTPNPLKSRYERVHIRGEKARWAHHDPRPCLVPPDWSGGYTSIFALQQGEEGAEPIRAYAG